MKKFPFGLDRDRILEQFQAITDGLETGDVIPQAVTFAEDQSSDEFITRTVSLTFAMKVEQGEDNGQLG